MQNMRTRETYLKEYGISDDYAEKLRNYCKTAKGEQQRWLLECAQSACPDIAPQLFYSLSVGVGYINMSKAQYIPIKRDDFQGYLRKTLEVLDRKLRWHNISL